MASTGQLPVGRMPSARPEARADRDWVNHNLRGVSWANEESSESKSPPIGGLLILDGQSLAARHGHTLQHVLISRINKAGEMTRQDACQFIYIGCSWAGACIQAVCLVALEWINGNAWALFAVPVIYLATRVSWSVPRLPWAFYALYPAHLAVLAVMVLR